MFKSAGFSIYPDRVEQGEFRATALNPEQMISGYASPAAGVDPVIQFKFSINGRDNELPFGVNHQANIFPEGDSSVTCGPDETGYLFRQPIPGRSGERV